jgi:hypothetical protein
MNDIYGWNVDKKWQMMNFFMNIHNKFCFAKKWRKEIRYKKFMLVYCEQFITWNVQVILELLFHILALQHPNHIKFKLHQIQWHINLLTHQEVCANSNSTFPPQRGIWPLGIETISRTPWHLTILNYFLFSFVLSTPWQFEQRNCILFFFTNLYVRYFNLHYLHRYFLIASSLPQFHACNHKTSLL